MRSDNNANLRNLPFMTANMRNSPVMAAKVRISPVMTVNMQNSPVMTPNMRIFPVDRYMSHIGYRICVALFPFLSYLHINLKKL